MNSIIETLTEVNHRKLCTNCQTIRKEWEPGDHKKHGCYSNMIPGFFSHTPIDITNSKNVDVMIVANSHGGGGGFDAFRPQKDVEFEVNSISKYYLQNRLDSFHQEQMRNLFEQLDCETVTWYFTDLVKCFVKHDGPNFSLAIGQCKNYLKYQIENLEIKVIVCLGSVVFSETTKLLGEQKQFKHGEIFTVGNYRIIASYFPAGFTANRWIANQKWERIIDKLRTELAK